MTFVIFMPLLPPAVALDTKRVYPLLPVINGKLKRNLPPSTEEGTRSMRWPAVSSPHTS